MKRIIMLVILGLLIMGIVSNLVEATEGSEQHSKGKIKIIKDFPMPQLDRERTIRVYLPPDYKKKRIKDIRYYI